jgi:hypothetical protein
LSFDLGFAHFEVLDKGSMVCPVILIKTIETKEGNSIASLELDVGDLISDVFSSFSWRLTYSKRCTVVWDTVHGPTGVEVGGVTHNQVQTEELHLASVPRGGTNGDTISSLLPHVQ